MSKVLLSIFCLLSVFSYAEEAAPSQESTPQETLPDIAKISQAFGQLMGKNLESMGLKFDIAKVIEGLQDVSHGRDPLMTEAECIAAMASVQENQFKELAAENLKKAEEFLAQNKAAPGVKDLEPSKLQYKIEKEGSGPVVDEKSAPLIRYTGKFFDGTAFGTSKEEDRIDLAEEEMIPGFKRALIGMKEGEKRVVFIHPDLGFGSKDYNLPPNSLLTVELEVVKANAPLEKPVDSLSTTTPHAKGNPEIAQPFENTKAIR